MQSFKNRSYGAVFVCLLVVTVLSCSKMNDTYRDFIKNGAIVYPGRVDSLLSFAGHERILLKWKMPTDRNITSYKLFWNFGADSLDVSPTPQPGTDTIRTYISSLNEGTYNFTVYSYDKQGHRSVGSQTIGNVYGPIFSSTISNRAIRTLVVSAPTSSIQVTWVGLDAKCLGTQWKYTGTDGLPKQYFSSILDTTYITSCNTGRPVSYRSLFVPEPNAIDTFYTDFKTL